MAEAVNPADKFPSPEGEWNENRLVVAAACGGVYGSAAETGASNGEGFDERTPGDTQRNPWAKSLVILLLKSLAVRVDFLEGSSMSH